jgi:hypothetical protein
MHISGEIVENEIRQSALARLFASEGVPTGAAVFLLSSTAAEQTGIHTVLLVDIHAWRLLAAIPSALLLLGFLWHLLFRALSRRESLLLGTVAQFSQPSSPHRRCRTRAPQSEDMFL